SFTFCPTLVAACLALSLALSVASLALSAALSMAFLTLSLVSAMGLLLGLQSGRGPRGSWSFAIGVPLRAAVGFRDGFRALAALVHRRPPGFQVADQAA